MQFNSLTETHIKALQSMVDADRFSTGESVLDLHARDQSYHPRSRPEAVIWPLSATEVSGIVKYADEHRIPITGWGSGSSLEGNPIPIKHGIVLDFSQMNRILEIREEDFQADVEPGHVKHLGFAGGYGHLKYRLFSWQPIPADRGVRVDIQKLAPGSQSDD